jgi:hypothetical protein
MTLGCHDRRPLSSLAFGRGWNLQLKLFCVRDFAAQGIAALSFGSAGVAIGDSSTAVIAVASRPAVNNGVLQTSAISRAPREGLIIEIVSEPIGNAWWKLA